MGLGVSAWKVWFRGARNGAWGVCVTAGQCGFREGLRPPGVPPEERSTSDDGGSNRIQLVQHAGVRSSRTELAYHQYSSEAGATARDGVHRDLDPSNRDPGQAGCFLVPAHRIDVTAESSAREHEGGAQGENKHDESGDREPSR